jgi:hypothetical protein
MRSMFYTDNGRRKMETIRTNSQKVHVSQKKGLCMLYDLNHDDSIYLQFMI